MNDTIEINRKNVETIDGCCPVFDITRWEEKNFHWEKKRFIRTSIPTFFHIPLPSMIAKGVKKMMEQVEGWDALDEDLRDTLLLFHDPHAFKTELLLSVTREVPGADNIELSGTFMAKVYDGPFKAVPRFMKEMKSYVKSQEKEVKDYYVHYAYCPKCALKSGHNYMVFFAKI